MTVLVSVIHVGQHTYTHTCIVSITKQLAQTPGAREYKFRSQDKFRPVGFVRSVSPGPFRRDATYTNIHGSIHMQHAHAA